MINGDGLVCSHPAINLFESHLADKPADLKSASLSFASQAPIK